MSERHAPHVAHDETVGGAPPPTACHQERPMKKSISLLGLLLAACSPAQPSAYSDSAGHGDMQHAAAASSTPVAKAFEAAADKMHKDMAVVLMADPDTDFMRSMIPHHEGAMAMANVALERGKDPEVRELAQSVIADQEREVVQMRSWADRQEKIASKSPSKAN